MEDNIDTQLFLILFPDMLGFVEELTLSGGGLFEHSTTNELLVDFVEYCNNTNRLDADNTGYIISVEILEDFHSWIVNKTLSSLVEKGLADYAWDDEKQDFVFSAKETTK